MGELKIKEITEYVENGINKTKMIIINDDKEQEIILEGSGKIKSTVSV